MRLIPVFLLLLLTIGCSESLEQQKQSLFSAIDNKDTQTAIKLLENNSALINSHDSCSWTPLMHVSQNGNQQTVQYLLKQGADTELGDEGDYTPLLLAAAENHAGIVEQLLKHGANINHQENTRGWTALIWAAKQGHTQSVAILLENGARTDIRDFQKNTALDWAIKQGHKNIANLIKPGN